MTVSFTMVKALFWEQTASRSKKTRYSNCLRRRIQNLTRLLAKRRKTKKYFTASMIRKKIPLRNLQSRPF